MPWNETLARHLSEAEASGFITDDESNKIRMLLTPKIQDVNSVSPAKPFGSGYKFGASSEKELNGVRPGLVATARRALQYCPQDFCVFDGLRTPAEQRVLVAKGASQTLKSKHLMQPSGFGHAVDLVPYVNRPVWDWERIWPIAAAMDLAATELGYADSIRWGGAWDRTLADFGGNLDAYKQECRLYAERHPGKDFLDGPHFEWVS
jgi:peptidoglycan L-alanyl-D-glutamate endopeptidase CwlK